MASVKDKHFTQNILGNLTEAEIKSGYSNILDTYFLFASNNLDGFTGLEGFKENKEFNIMGTVNRYGEFTAAISCLSSFFTGNIKKWNEIEFWKKSKNLPEILDWFMVGVSNYRHERVSKPVKLKKGEVWSYKNKENNQIELGVIVGATGESMLRIVHDLPRNPIFIPELYDVVLFNWKEIGLDKESLVKCSQFVNFSNGDLISKVTVLREEEIHQISDQLRIYFN